MVDQAPPATPSYAEILGSRIRHARQKRKMTLKELGAAVERGSSLISQIENGRREPRLPLLRRIAEALDVDVSYLLKQEAPNERTALAMELQFYQNTSAYDSMRLPHVHVTSRLPTDTLKALVGLHRQLRSHEAIRAATPEKARMENKQLRQQMLARNNYVEEIEELAAQICSGVGHSGGPLDEKGVHRIAAYLGFQLHPVTDLPPAARAVRDVRHQRLYIPQKSKKQSDMRMTVLRSLAGVALNHAVPQSFGEFLHQRVYSNYLAAALLMPEKAAVELLEEAKKKRELSVHALSDAFRVRYETAAHRFTNLATQHFDIRLHFGRISNEGIIYKAYANDGICFPTDVTGAVEGQLLCRNYASRQAFLQSDPSRIYYQYTDTPVGTYFCTAQVVGTSGGNYSIGLGVPFEASRWFKGRATRHRKTSSCPDPICCRLPASELAQTWDGQAFPEVKAHSHLLAAMPPGAFPGVDTSEVYEFLDRHTQHQV
ncbi:MAG: helix-turn-helix domain-containing protein [Actinomycetaceae bacterium]|nr:helix-turn-helix domain-containing protein [Actinomycetaceae bacterium]